MSLDAITSLALIGAGKMGGAMLAGWLNKGLRPAAVTIVDPSPSDGVRALAARHALVVSGLEDALKGAPTVVVLAVKPQAIKALLPLLAPLLAPETLVASIAAGVTLANLESMLGKRPMVRAMPNVPAEIGMGMTVAVANSQVNAKERAIVTALMDAIGLTAWIEREDDMNAVTAISGSGPAYVFLLTEALAAAGRAQGLSAELADLLARQTVVGAGALLARSPLDPARLRDQVTSPGGTTAAALGHLQADNGLEALLKKAVDAACRRAHALSLT